MEDNFGYAFNVDLSKSDDPISLFPVRKNGKWGYIDRDGNIVIEPRFVSAFDFSEGLARVILPSEPTSKDIQRRQRNPLEIFVDSFSHIKASERVEKRIRRHAFINYHGEIVFEISCDVVDDFSEGLACFRIGDSVTGKCGYIDLNGQVVIEPRFERAQNFSEGFAEIKLKFMSGYIDRSGEIVINAVYDEAHPFSDGLALVKIGKNIDGKKGFIDKNNEFKIQPKYRHAFSFSDGLAVVCPLSFKENEYGYIDKNGEYAVKPQYFSAKNFSEGLAFVSKTVCEGSQLASGYDGSQSYNYQIIDKRGEILTDPIYFAVGSFSEGLCKVSIIAKPGHFYDWVKPDKFGYIDVCGTLKIPYLFDEARDFHNGLAHVRVEDSWGYIDHYGKFVYKPTR